MLEFEVFFDKDFEWVQGGKMHGFISGNPDTDSTGCAPQPKNGWSFRLMWVKKGTIILYIYDQSRIQSKEKCGVGTYSSPNVLVKDRWLNIKMYMKLNSKGDKSDGVARLYIDNKLILQRNDIKFRGVDTGATIDYIIFSTFYGGSDTSWSPSKTTYAYYRGAKLYDSDILNSA